VRHERAKGGSM